MTHLDTSFVVDLLRGRATAAALLDSLRDEELWNSVHAACELFAGAELSRSPRNERKKIGSLLGGVQVAHPGEGFPEVYARLLAQLSSRGRRIATMDLLIATSAVQVGAKLVTRDGKDFSRIPGLTVATH